MISRVRSLGVAARLAILLAGLAGLSMGFALVLQDRALDQDLRRAARARLQRSALAAERVIRDHLQGVADRYASISRTPEFRANLGTAHAPTLGYFASQLLDSESAALVAFLGRDGALLAPAGDPRLVGAVEDRVWAEGSPDQESCVTVADPGAPGRAGGSGRSGTWEPCRYPEGPPQATLFRSRGELYTLVTVPLRTGEWLVGGLVTIEPVSPQVLATWSELSGGAIHWSAAPATAELQAPVRSFPRAEIRISTTYAAERAAISRARRDLVASGLGVLLLALVAAYFLASGFARPIVQMREATERLTEGRLDQRIDLDREDEIGQLGRAFNDLASRLRESQERLRRAQRLARFGSWYLDFETRTAQGTEEFHRLFGVGEDEGAVAWDEILARINPEDRDELESAIARARRQGGAFRVDVRVPLRAGRDRILHLRGQVRSDQRGRIEASAQDVTERRAAEEQIRYLALHDPLTGLGNREYLRERLSMRLRGHGARRPLVLLFIGLDDFQAVNDSFGPALCDALLTEVADRLLQAVATQPARERDEEGPAATVVRAGGDRFGVILEEVDGQDETAHVAQRLLALLGEPYAIEGEEITLTASAGITRWPDDADDVDTLLRNCDTALHRSKVAGRGQYAFFDESMHHDASRRLRVSGLLRQAVERQDLELHYQPRVLPETEEVVGFEALARWTDPELGFVSPAEFIPVAEATGVIGPLGEWCLDEAARQLRAWTEAGYDRLSVSVNLSRHQLEPELIDSVLAATEGLVRSQFELEVTESAIIEDADAAIEILSELRSHGFPIALDDFGTGYSSLSHLRGLPIDTVKLDREFIRAIADDEHAAALVGSVLDMCRALGLHTVIEGIETEAQREILLRLGCEEAQGYLFSKPMPAPQTLEYLSGAKVSRSAAPKLKAV